MRAFWALAATAALGAAPAAAQHHGQHPPAPPHPPMHGQHRPPPPPPGEHAHASQVDHRAVLTVVDRMFAGLAAKDPRAILAEVIPEGRATATSAEHRRMTSMAWPAFVEHIAELPGRPVERLIDPHVHVEGDIAMIWSRYEIEIDGRFLHCGIDHFDMVRQDGRWRVLNLTWTQQTRGCPGRDGPPPRPRVGEPHGERG